MTSRNTVGLSCSMFSYNQFGALFLQHGVLFQIIFATLDLALRLQEFTSCSRRFELNLT